MLTLAARETLTQGYFSLLPPGDHFGYFTDFLKRLTLARQWVETHKSEYAAIRSEKANLDPTVSLHWISNADMTVGPVDPQATRDFRETSDFLYHTGYPASSLRYSKGDRSFICGSI